jgi:hypothetical protein
MYDFDIRELMLIHSSLVAVANLATEDDSAPQGLLEATQSTIKKIENVVEQRVMNDNNFAELVEASLLDVDKYGQQLINETENK